MIGGITFLGLSLKVIAFLAVGGAGLLLIGIGFWKSRGMPAPVPDQRAEAVRDSDALPPEGAVEYVQSIRECCPAAPPDFILKHLADGATKTDVREAWITLLESRVQGSQGEEKDLAPKTNPAGSGREEPSIRPDGGPA